MRIGIITYYYKSINYGGNLQAYALVKVLQGYGCKSVEQISFSWRKPKTNSTRKSTIARLCKVMKMLVRLKTHRGLSLRKRAISLFNESIPHSACCYNTETINRCLNYDVYITGSDQVWNAGGWNNAFRLDFVPSDRVKLSYAASISCFELADDDLAVFKKSLSDYQAVSVREQDAIELIQAVSPVEVEWTLDPTLLLTNSEWDEICTKRLIKQNYMFCYYLGEDNDMRKLAEEYGKRHNLRIVTLPHLLGAIRKCDIKFGNKKLYNIAPDQFLSLIRYANIIFTDSFHATVFSAKYSKEYFIFHRSGHEAMATRIRSLTALFKTEERFCDTTDRMSLEYIESLNPIDYSRPLTEFEQMREKSMSFLKDNIQTAKERLLKR